MNEAGFIHFDCFCGADLYYLVCQAGDEDQDVAVNALTRLIEHPHFAIYTASDGVSGDCPHCGAIVELPVPSTVALLRSMSRTPGGRIDFGVVASGAARER
ncbi:MAG TPA: hypothetical protein VFI27_10800 [candidate division Zixibacteria bacterium]|nr:hypothetical protein [candidate division Zixibacteria bacterium]